LIPRDWQIKVKNDSSVTVTVTVQTRGYKLTSAGALEYESAAVTLTNLNAASVASGATATSTTVTNSANLFLGMHIEAKVVTPSGNAPAGNKQLIVYIQRSADSGTDFDNTDAHILAIVPMTAAATTYIQTAEVPI